MVQEPPGAARPTPIVEIYTWQYCPFCLRAKSLLDRKGVVYQEHCIDGDPVGRQQMIRRTGGRSSVPQIFIDNRSIGGCDELQTLERRGELDALLGEQG